MRRVGRRARHIARSSCRPRPALGSSSTVGGPVGSDSYSRRISRLARPHADLVDADDLPAEQVDESPEHALRALRDDGIDVERACDRVDVDTSHHPIDVDPIRSCVEIDTSNGCVQIDPGNGCVEIDTSDTACVDRSAAASDRHGDGCVDVDAIDDRIQIDTIDHPLHVDLIHDGVQIEPGDDPFHVDPVDDRIDVEPGDELRRDRRDSAHASRSTRSRSASRSSRVTSAFTSMRSRTASTSMRSIRAFTSMRSTRSSGSTASATTGTMTEAIASNGRWNTPRGGRARPCTNRTHPAATAGSRPGYADPASHVLDERRDRIPPRSDRVAH